MTLPKIQDSKQYKTYCDLHEIVAFKCDDSDDTENFLEMLYGLIDAWDQKYLSVSDLDPVGYLKLVMEEHELTVNKLAKIIEVKEWYLLDVLEYKKPFTKKMIKALSIKFALIEEAFNRPYKLKT